MKKFNRRQFLLGSLLAAPLLAAADSGLEHHWIRTRRLRLGKDKPAHRFVHITDIHHKGDIRYFQKVVKRVNALSPEFVCFTGDLIEDGAHLDEALGLLSGIKAPLYGVPGNHDYWARVSFGGVAKCFAASGGAWLEEDVAVTADGKFAIMGSTCLSSKQLPLRVNASTRNIFLMHYPVWVEKMTAYKFDLLLAGHSHGGQVRLPFYGPLMVPFGVGRYDLGLFHTPSGPLYVNPGIGWFPVPIRFNCRPEITVFEV